MTTTSKSIVLCFLCAATLGVSAQVAHADNYSASREFANATFEGEVRFTKVTPLINGRFCSVARRLSRPIRQSVRIEGGLEGEGSFLAYGRVNGTEGVGFYNSEDNPNGTGFDLLIGSVQPLLRGGRSFSCGLWSRYAVVSSLADGRVGLTYRESIGCEERGGQRRGYVCFDREYKGFGQRTPR
jgi:hypothetical protein